MLGKYSDNLPLIVGIFAKNTGGWKGKGAKIKGNERENAKLTNKMHIYLPKSGKKI